MINNFFFDEKAGFLCYKTTKDDMLKVDEILERDFSKSNLLNSKTVSNEKSSRIAGILGEIVFQKFMGDSATFCGRGSVPFDFIVKSKGRELKVDVKCKTRNYPPRNNFMASIYNYQMTGDFFKRCDYYVFMQTLRDKFDFVWLCGMLNKNKFVDNPHSKLWMAGDVDADNGMKFRVNTWTIPYQHLIQFPKV